MITTNKSGIVAFVNACVKQGMNNVVCSPGSRNAPLVIAFDAHPEVKTYVVHDERSAAFYAMGMAQELEQPVGIVCTSGSAMLNYYPAVAEAFYQSIPLVVISADRPAEWVNHGDGQTIVQTGVYKNHIKFECSISEELSEDNTNENVNELIESAFNKGNIKDKGPIHFNVPVTEPLYKLEQVDYIKEELPSVAADEDLLSAELLSELKEKWNQSEKKMILCGQGVKNDRLQYLLSELANDTSLVILVENTSNLHHSSFIHCIDRTISNISESEISSFQPDLLVTLGGAVVSKRIKQFLRKSSINEHWRVGYSFPEMDTYRALTKSLQVDDNYFVSVLNEIHTGVYPSMFGAKWKQKDFLSQEKSAQFFEEIPYSDLSVFETILDFIPEQSYLHMGNSSVVRYCQLFDPIKSIKYFCNRGTSGIDGCTSTACGVALKSPSKCNVLITGDVSFFYDSNALWSNHMPSNLRIILINNSGGGIFKIIDGPSSTDQLEKYFEAKHPFSAEYICKAFNVTYFKAKSNDEIEILMDSFYAESEGDTPKLLEIFTPSSTNDKVLKDFFLRISNS